ncbi:hypothetical protein [Mycoplasmopsis cynos]|uniref:hypothetical protein n=1 Tax=Mycoplasmopsis cynos TaxID=171284 RepID=UPI002205A484|nr:hypothetical protein [Mycoplasmopsis cynos]UWV81657.1 hypothetical protein NW065_00550 [Mycoplasmopsis cynos]
MNKLNYIFLNSIAIASIVCFVLSWLAFGLKIGLLSKTIDKIRNLPPEFQERKEKVFWKKWQKMKRESITKQRSVNLNIKIASHIKHHFHIFLIV